ncbi:MAG: hypothetical protein A3J66_01520 [Candidatus Magasanikbacteria bacterium RIFCSPHIGHO2_02_FULL_47_14]|uniref:Orotate phosphoribosyltransferase n=1 Tax=Candidatus Magasanikbacteria bacterium RIFCSPHIGHO2_02_FULL_47_14 TaxID=1798680 RepID=A0A1F6MB53_9BACT|nr:MAG: hypothetical protein A3J66_01520 [Candidatus Magasanikbacteria bacterium RIFCSPHIGHO2_02_FULL_47_14]
MSAPENEWLQKLAKLGAVLTDGHFVYTSGNHGPTYVDKRTIVVYAVQAMALCHELAVRLRRCSSGVEALVSPAVGAIPLGFGTAFHLSRVMGSLVLSFVAEKNSDGGFLVTTAPSLLAGKRVMVVEDILNTGGSAEKVITLARSLDAEVIGVAALVNRGGVTAEALGVEHLVTLVDVQMPMYPADVCPLCAAGVPINTNVGHGAAFLAARQG